MVQSIRLRTDHRCIPYDPLFDSRQDRRVSCFIFIIFEIQLLIIAYLFTAMSNIHIIISRPSNQVKRYLFYNL
jgi:hypothetical protein